MWTEVLHQHSQGWPGCVDDIKTWGSQDQGSSPQASEPYESHLLHVSSKNLGRSSHTSVPTTALPGATNSSRDSSARCQHERWTCWNQCAESARSCSIAQRPLCPLPIIVTMMFCPAPSRLELILTITIEDNVAPPAQIFSSYQLTGDIGNHDEDPAQAPSKVEERPKV